MYTLIFEIRGNSAHANVLATTMHAAVAPATRTDRATASVIVDATATNAAVGIAVDITAVEILYTLHYHSCKHSAAVI